MIKKGISQRKFIKGHVIKEPNHKPSLFFPQIIPREFQRFWQYINNYVNLYSMGIRKYFEQIINLHKSLLERSWIDAVRNSGSPHKNPKFSEKVAYHEAGHLVTAWDRYPVPALISILKQGKSNGFVAYPEEMPTLDKLGNYNEDGVWSRLMNAVAGQEAEKIRYGEDAETGFGQIENFLTPVEPDRERPVDAEVARLCCLELVRRNGISDADSDFESHCQGYLDQACASARNNLAKNWAAVEALAQELAKKHVLGGQEIKKIKQDYEASNCACTASI